MTKKPDIERKRRLLLTEPLLKVAGSIRQVLETRWRYGPRLGAKPTELEREEYVVEMVKETVALLMPEHEGRARDIVALIKWPEGFGRIPTFEKLAGIPCKTCKGTGVAGYLFGIRCPDC